MIMLTLREASKTRSKSSLKSQDESSSVQEEGGCLKTLILGLKRESKFKVLCLLFDNKLADGLSLTWLTCVWGSGRGQV